MKAAAALHCRVGHKPGGPEAWIGNLNLYYGHMSNEGSLAFNCNDCHACSLRGSIATDGGLEPLAETGGRVERSQEPRGPAALLDRKCHRTGHDLRPDAGRTALVPVSPFDGAVFSPLLARCWPRLLLVACKQAWSVRRAV